MAIKLKEVDDPTENKGPPILAGMWALTMVTLLIVMARMYIRIAIVRNFGLDDWLIAVSMLLGLAYLGITTANVLGGYGKHAITLSLEAMQDAIFLNSLSFVFGILSFAMPKLAVVAMLNKILNPGKFHRYFLWIFGVFTVLVSCGCIVILFAMCKPSRGLWEVTIGAKCVTPWILIHYSYFVGALSAFTDMYLAVYPTTVLFKLQMSLRKKLALSAALGLGSVAAAMAIVKVTQLKGLADKSDYTYGTVELVLWTNIEADAVVIASCIPTLQPLLERISKRKFGPTKDSKYFNKLSKGGSNGYTNGSSTTDRVRSKERSNNKSLTGVESQESILNVDENNRSRGNDTSHIRVTDDVYVEYEMQDQMPRKGSRRAW